MFINNFDPVAIQIFSIEIRWYSLAYIFGILLGWLYCKKLLIQDKNTSKVVGSMIKDLPLPEGVVVGAIVRDNELLMGSKKLVIEQGDHVIMMLTDVGKIHQVEALFSENE